jgi:hypothetical protein
MGLKPKHKALSIKTSQDQNNSEDRYKVSKLLKENRDLSVAHSMPWAPKEKDNESRPDYAYSEVVRKKDERKRMHPSSSDCPCCKDLRNLVIQSQKSQYPDRPAQMRKLHGGNGKTKVKKKRLKIKPTVSASKPIPDDNIGNKMLKKMGWKSGEGLGANNDGIREPVSVFLFT